MNSLCIILCKQVNLRLYNAYSKYIKFYNLIFISDKKPLIDKHNIYYISDIRAIKQNYKYMTSFLKCSAWDKAIKYIIDNNYDYYWLIEDDVYINDNINTIFKTYNSNKTDFLYSSWKKKYTEMPEWYHWKKNKHIFKKKELTASLNVFCRISKRLISRISEFKTTYHRLLFHELFFASLCEKYKLTSLKIKETSVAYISAKNNKSTKNKLYECRNKNISVYHPIKLWYYNI